VKWWKDRSLFIYWGGVWLSPLDMPAPDIVAAPHDDDDDDDDDDNESEEAGE
jgi:hypothetical protein